MNIWQRFLQQLGLVEPQLPGSPRFEAAIWPIRLLLVILALAAVRELLASLYCGSSGTPATASEFFVSICFIVESGELSRLKAFRAGPGIAK
jgi:hypothetical protein